MDALIVFDMDGVLAEVTESYREAIQQTVEHFTGRRPERDLIQWYKNAGGWNNDWALSQKIAADWGVAVPYQTVVDYFNQIFIGHDGDGLIRRESWLPERGLLERLGGSFGLSIFTGRLRYELDYTLRRFAPGIAFDPILCADDVARSKPAPDGLLMIGERKPTWQLIYVGDTVDDARSARAAGVPFIGIAARGHSRREEVADLFAQEQAIAVLETVNDIEAAIQEVL
ncbi:MAG TPA: HAD hydrolase-like protein [Bryobacteraceae bacterium]|nr:HAD hydrolase-like protein [Bryobacteraceae bacterium]